MPSILPFEITDDNYHDIVKKLVTDNRKVTKGTNLQNIPSRGIGKRVRQCFVPPKDWVFIGADLSSIEPRIMAHILWTRYQDNSLRAAYLIDQDPYVDVAEDVFQLPREYCLDDMWYDPVSKTGGNKNDKTKPMPLTAFEPRKLAKQGMLAVAYRQSEKGFAKSMNVSVEVASHFIKTFNEKYPLFELMVSDIIEFMKEHGYSQTLWGRKRRFPLYEYYFEKAEQNEEKLTKLYRERKKLFAKGQEIGQLSKDDQARVKQINDMIQELRGPRGKCMKMERDAFNAVIQGSGADILKQNGIRMARVCKERGWLMPASIHDELIIAVPKKDVTPETIELVRDVMTKTVTGLSVPLKTDIVIMPRWEENYKPEEWFAKFTS